MTDIVEDASSFGPIFFQELQERFGVTALEIGFVDDEEDDPDRAEAVSDCMSRKDVSVDINVMFSHPGAVDSVDGCLSSDCLVNESMCPYA